MPARKRIGARSSKAKAVPSKSKRKPVPKKAAPSKSKRKSVPKKSADYVTVYCSRCGTAGSTVRGGIPGGWSVGFAGGRLEHICIACARTNIRAIEGKLPEEWWE